MRKELLAGIATLAFATSAQAAPILTSAQVNGVTAAGTATGTVWNTDSSDTFYALFLQNPLGNILNPNDNFGGFTPDTGVNDFTITGDGFPVVTSTTPANSPTRNNSDLFYRLTLGFNDGAMISGIFNPATQMFTSAGAVQVGRTVYSLDDFGWSRAGANTVSPFKAVKGGSLRDYTGEFSFSVSDVPEPATWGLMILGFGMVGGAMRRRGSVSTTVRFA